jgi:Mrp family chromosome partitioning ATPase
MPQAAPKLEPFAPPVDVQAENGPGAPDRPYAELAFRLLGGRTTRKVIAFASASSREGVSYVVAGLAAELARIGHRATVIDGNTGFDGTSILRAPGAEPALSFYERHETSGCLLVDCGSLEQSLGVLTVARRVDGTVLVVEAGRRSTHQVQRAAKLIEEAGGTFLGCVLNKRCYPIPGWLYRML